MNTRSARRVILEKCKDCRRKKYLDSSTLICSSCISLYVRNPIGMLVKKNLGGNTPHKKGPGTHPVRKGYRSPRLGRVVKPGAWERKHKAKPSWSRDTIVLGPVDTSIPSTGEPLRI